MKENLENKIREALPRLKELTKGCIVFGVDGAFHQFGEYAEVVNVTIEKGYIDTHILECFTIDSGNYNRFLTAKKHWDTYNIEVIGHPIKLSDVLEYYKNSNFEHGVNMMFEREWKNGCHYIVDNWDLSSVFLADQNDEIKEFLNSL